MNEINNYLNVVKDLLRRESLPLVISIQNTVSSAKLKNSLYSLPIRILNSYIFCGICNGNNEENLYFLEKAQPLARYILIDVEKKYPWNESTNSDKLYVGNIEKLLKNHLDPEKVIYIWPNSMTVEACITAITDNNSTILSSSKIAIIGIGNIGFKLALRLIEAGCNTSISSNDYNSTLQLSTLINLIKPKSTIASPVPFRETASCVSGKEFIIFCTGSSLMLDEQIVNNISKHTKIYTLSRLKISSKIEKILKEKHISIETIDITPYYYIEVMKNNIIKLKDKPTRKYINNKWIVSGGYQGKKGDLIVDRAEDPKILIGKIDEEGIFKRNISLWSKNTNE